ncbi:Rpn family recombination-promoting nuclease/putative transposase [Microcoleus sp. ARI1-B5]|uniref:Rpn family recombination-promoting nuclease/putative transposase n=1 Tax=unclassified Microcoleus TaxID=2642155 RepID=UPI002FCE6B6C
MNSKIYFAFTKIFGSPDNTDILIDFLNALLYEGKTIIESLEIIDPNVTYPIIGSKNSYLDVQATLNNSTSVIIKIQVLHVRTSAKLVLSDTAKTYGTQFMIRELYKGLQPVIFLAIADFKMFNHHLNVTSRFALKETTHLFDYPYTQMELVFLELPKFKKELDQLENITDRWIYFIKNSGVLREIPAILGEVPQINRAFEIAKDVNLTREEFDILQKQEFFAHDQQSYEQTSFEQGRKEGLELARQEILKKGQQQGQISAIIRFLNRRLGQLNPDTQTRIGELSIDKLENLAEALLDFSNAEDLTAWLQANSQ